MATGPRAVILCKRICFLTPSTQVVPRAAGGCQPAAGRRARPEPSFVVTQRDSAPEASEAHQAMCKCQPGHTNITQVDACCYSTELTTHYSN